MEQHLLLNHIQHIAMQTVYSTLKPLFEHHELTGKLREQIRAFLRTCEAPRQILRTGIYICECYNLQLILNQLIFDFKLLNVVHNQLVAAVHEDTNDTITAIDMTARRFDQRHAQPKEYAVEDSVLIENDLVVTGESRKLEMKWKGPYTVRKCLGKDRYVIGDIDGAPVTGRKFDFVYTAAKMRPWCQSPQELDETDEDDINTEDTEGIARMDVNQATCDEDLT